MTLGRVTYRAAALLVGAVQVWAIWQLVRVGLGRWAS